MFLLFQKVVYDMQASQYLSPTDVIKLGLDKLPVFQELHLDDLENLLAVCQLKVYEPDDIIIKTGSHDPWLYILLEGKATVFVEGIEVTVIHTRGALFGEAALIDSSERKADVVAQTECTCLSIDSILMKEVLCTTNMKFYAHFYKHITTMLSERLNKTSEELALVKKAFQHILS